MSLFSIQVTKDGQVIYKRLLVEHIPHVREMLRIGTNAGDLSLHYEVIGVTYVFPNQEDGCMVLGTMVNVVQRFVKDPPASSLRTELLSLWARVIGG